MTNEWTSDCGEFVITTNAARFDVNAIHDFLAHDSYWAQNIPRPLLEKAIENSLCFGVLRRDNESQVGFARVVTDRATFAYVCDVFIVEPYRGRGLSKWLMQSVRAHSELQHLRRWMLVTRDAHALYAQSGFASLDAPERVMQVVTPNPYAPKKETHDPNPYC